MLKKIRLLFLGLIVLAGSACVTPTHASSASTVLITYIQAAGPTGAKEELVVLHNNSAVEVDITDWCLVNKAIVAFGCFTAEAEVGYAVHFVLPPYQSATVASHEYITSRGISSDEASVMYEVTSQSSGSLVNSAENLLLVDAQGDVVDSRTWTGAPQSGKAWSRVKIMSSPDIYATGNDAIDWSVISWTDLPENGVERRVVEVEGEGREGNSPDSPNPSTPSTLPPIILSEMLPNAKGIDTGKEFLEFHNTSLTDEYLLDGFRLRIGLDSAKWYPLPNGIHIPAGNYKALTDTELGLTLVNTHGGVHLYYGDIPIGERVEYMSPKDDEAWALIDGVWQYTNIATPDSANVASHIASDKGEKASATAIPKPCASNQFRNPETGRCKLIASTTNTPSPCKPGQERNPETNRCRAIAAIKTPTPCKEGQERNLETNRCRNVKKMTTVDHGVKGVQETAGTQLSWYYWAAMIGVILLILGYAVWEWRHELRIIWQRAAGKFAKK